MELIDALLLEAWHEVSAELESKPYKLARRMERTQRKELRRPVRAWCVALRASDSRIGAHELRAEGDVERCRRGYTHHVELTGERLRELCRPVRIDWPGVAVAEAARALGRDVRTVQRWSDVGVLQKRHDAEPGRRGLPTRWVWSDKAIDPQADDGRGPWAVWGSLWQGLSGRVPADFVQRVERTPRLRDSAKDWRTAGDAWPGRYRGWDWLCPGRVVCDGTTTGQHLRCGRVCKKLWLPLPAWTIGDALGDRAGEAWRMMERVGGDPSASASPTPRAWGMQARGLACSRCWGLRFDSYASVPAEAWNRFVSVVSGGLLYGREVDRARVWESVA